MGDGLREYFVGPMQLVRSSGPEMDINRAARAAAHSGVRRLIATLKRFTPGFFTVQRLKRSGDRGDENF